MTRRYLPMLPAEMADYLATHRVARVATTSLDNELHVVPMWFVMLDGRIVVRSASDAGTKMRNIMATGRFACVVDDGNEYETLRGVMIRGHARVLDPTETHLAERAFSVKYYHGGDGFNSLPQPVQEILKHLTFTYAELIPEKITSWDNSKWTHDKIS